MSADLYQIRNFKHKPSTKQTIKFLATCSDPKVQRVVLNSANDSVFKSICNAFLNLAENPQIQVSPNHTKLIARHSPRIRRLLSTKVPIRKKKVLIQKGGSLFLGTVLPMVISSALSFLGTRFLSYAKHVRK